jgi:hypothetical protein
MKKGILLAAVVLMSVGGLAQAQPEAQKNIGVTLDVTYASRYIWRGFDVYANNHSAIQPRLTIDWMGSGFGTTVFYSRANGSGFEEKQEYDYSMFYTGHLAQEEVYATNYTIGWTYYQYPELNRKSNAQEAFLTISMPRILPGHIVPSYTVVKMWPAVSHSDVADNYDDSGWAHIVGLGYDLRGVIPNMPDQAIHLSADAVYNDGVGPHANVAHDWSDAVFGISSGFAVTDKLTVTPGFYYQSSWEDTVDTSDEYWATVNAAYKF